MPPIDSISISDIRHSFQKSHVKEAQFSDTLSLQDKMNVYLLAPLLTCFEKFYTFERQKYHPSEHDQIINDDFDAHFQSLLSVYENKLKGSFAHFLKRLALSAPFALILIIASLWWVSTAEKGNLIHSIIAPFILLNCSLTLLFACLWSWQPLAKLKKNYPDYLLPEILNSFGDGFALKNDCPISINNLTASNIIPPCTAEAIDSYIVGNYRNAKVEILLARLTPPLNEQTAPRQLKQNYIVATLNRSFASKTILLSENAGHDRAEEELERERRYLEGFRLVNTPKTMLTTNFEVWSNNAPKTKSLLSGDILAAVTNLFVLAPKKEIKLSLYGDKLVASQPRLKFETNYATFAPTKNIRPAIQDLLIELKPILDLIRVLEAGTDDRTADISANATIG